MRIDSTPEDWLDQIGQLARKIGLSSQQELLSAPPVPEVAAKALVIRASPLKTDELLRLFFEGTPESLAEFGRRAWDELDRRWRARLADVLRDGLFFGGAAAARDALGEIVAELGIKETRGAKRKELTDREIAAARYKARFPQAKDARLAWIAGMRPQHFHGKFAQDKGSRRLDFLCQVVIEEAKIREQVESRRRSRTISLADVYGRKTTPKSK